MLTRKFITFGKLFALLMLISYSVAAKSVEPENKFHQQHKESLDKTGHFFHSNMLQPQVVHVNAMPEHSVKPIASGFGILSYSDNALLLSPPLAQTQTFLQDMDRCESVSRLLFPYHIFW